MKHYIFTTTEYSIEHATFLDLPPVYQSDDSSNFKINFCVNTHRSADFSTLIGLSYCDRKYRLFLDILIHKPIVVSDSDILGHDIYVEKLNTKQTIVLYFSDLKTSPSKKRILHAVKKLRSKGFTVNYFSNKKTAEKFVSKKLEKLNSIAA